MPPCPLARQSSVSGSGVTTITTAATMHGMIRPPDQPPSPSPSKSKLSAEERRARQADRLKTIRLRMAIGRELDERGITTPAAIGEALGMPAQEGIHTAKAAVAEDRGRAALTASGRG
jgi:hypothetical protein